jgi:hypothetical protein
MFTQLRSACGENPGTQPKPFSGEWKIDMIEIDKDSADEANR